MNRMLSVRGKALSVFLLLFGLGIGLSAPAFAQLNGTYTIGPSGNYTTFQAAVTALTTSGVSGPVTFNVAAGTYTEKIVIPQISGASTVNTITFDGGAGNAANVVLQYNASSTYDYTLQLNGADYIRLKNLTIKSSNSTYGAVLWFAGLTEQNQVTDCIIQAPLSTTSTSYAIVGSGSTTSPSTSSSSTPRYNLFQNNQIKGGYYCIYWYGYAGNSSLYATDNQFIDNTITAFHYYGMYLYYQRNILVRGNTFLDRTDDDYGYGIMSYYSRDGGLIEKNYAKCGYAGGYFYYSNYYGYTTSTARFVIRNNMFVARGASTNYGILNSYAKNTDTWNNSCYMLNSSYKYGLYQYYSSSYGAGNTTYNNYIAAKNYYTYHYMIYNNDATFWSGGGFDYNAFYTPPGTYTYMFYYGASYYSTWAALPKTTHNSHSVFGEPYYVSDTDLHCRSHVGYRKGLPLAGVIDDFDGDLRDPMYPSIGADEYPTPPPEYDLAVNGVLFDYAINSWARLEAPREHKVKAVIENVGLKTDPSTVTVVYKVDGIPADPTDGVAQTFTPVWSNHKAVIEFTQPMGGLTANTTPKVYVRSFLTNEENIANDVMWDAHLVKDSKHYGFEDFNTMVAPYFSADPGMLDYKWSTQNGGGPVTFQVGTNGVGGTNAAEYPGDVVMADDWLITPGSWLVAGSSYRFEMQARSVSGQPQTVEIAFGDSPDPASMTVFATLSNFTNTNFLSCEALSGGTTYPWFNTPNIHQLYYIGIHVVSPAGSGAVAFDDMTLDANPNPPPKIAYGLPGSPIGAFVDDPAVPIQVTANYKQPGLINRTYQVASSTDYYGPNGDFLWDVETKTPWITLTKEPAAPTMQGYNFVPPRPRQFQSFTMTIDPSGLAPGVHMGQLAFYGMLFNDKYGPPSNGLKATNEVFYVNVELRVSSAGSKGSSYISYQQTGPMTSGGNPWYFNDPTTNELIAIVNVTGGQIDDMTITAFPNQLPLNIARMRYVKRYWQIAAVGSWTADITFPYADQEAAMVTDKMQLRGVRQPVMAGGWEVPIFGTTSVSDAMNNMVTVVGMNENNFQGNIALAHPYYIAGKSPEQGAVTEFALDQNYPNPFNPSTSVSFNVGEESPVRLAVYNSLGEQVAELVNETLASGRYTVQFDGSTLSSGTYTYRLTAGGKVFTRHMTLSK